MLLTSDAFENGGKIPSVYTCEGKNIPPPLTVADVPQGAKSLSLILDDPDVPAFVRKDQMWDHWVIYNIPADTRKIAPEIGIEGKHTGGGLGYDGPCPPDREHRYFFKLYALDIKLPLTSGATKKEVEKAMQGHILAESILIGRYKKKHD